MPSTTLSKFSTARRHSSSLTPWFLVSVSRAWLTVASYRSLLDGVRACCRCCWLIVDGYDGEDGNGTDCDDDVDARGGSSRCAIGRRAVGVAATAGGSWGEGRARGRLGVRRKDDGADDGGSTALARFEASPRRRRR